MDFINIPTIEFFQQDCENAAQINTQNIDEVSDIGPLMRALQAGEVYIEPPAPKVPVLKAGRSYDLPDTRVAKSADDEWRLTIGELAETTTKASEPAEPVNDFQAAVVERLMRAGFTRQEALEYAPTA